MTWLVDLLDRGALPISIGRSPGLPPRPPIAITAVACVGWGLAIGAVAGGAAGATVLLPLLIESPAAVVAFPTLGAAYGLLVGLAVAVVPTTVGALVVVTMLVRRHPTVEDPAVVRRDVARCFAGLLVTLVGGAAASGLHLLAQTPDIGLGVVLAALWLVAEAVFVTWVCARLLRVAACSVVRTWCRPFGWEEPAAPPRLATPSPSQPG